MGKVWQVSLGLQVLFAVSEQGFECLLVDQSLPKPHVVISSVAGK